MKDIPRLELTTAWRIWRECLVGEDPNSIFQQISHMIWDTAIFRIINEGHRLQFKKNPGCPEINSSVQKFIVRTYVHSQCATIRRLTDQSSPLVGEKGVYSLSKLINVMLSYREEFTRAKFFEFRGLRYDYSEIITKRKAYFKILTSGEAENIPREYDWENIEEAHQTFDQLSGATKASRSQNDVILIEVFTTLQNDLNDASTSIGKFVNKFIAHSATQESRMLENGVIGKITFRQLWDAQRVIYQIAELLSSVFFGVSHIALALESPTFYSYWEKPIFTEDEAGQVEVIFEKFKKETENWRLSAESHYLHMFRKLQCKDPAD